MIKFKDYDWVLEGLASLLLLVAFVFMIISGTNEVSKIVIQLTGIGILFFTVMRIKPIISSRNDKDYVLVMFSEILIDLIVGLTLLLFPTYIQGGNVILSFSRLVGLVFFIRGISHFWTTAKRYELHDIISFIVHVLFMSFGFLYLYANNLKEEKVVIALIILSILLTLYFGYRSYNGYNNFRIQKGNALKVNDYLDKDKKKEKEEIIEDPKSIEDTRIEEPKDEDRPSIDVN